MARTDGISEFVPQGEMLATEQGQQEIIAALNLNTGINMANSVLNSAVDVGTSSTLVLAANSSRRYLFLVNDSDENIYLSLGSAATLNEGILLTSQGGALTLDTSAMYAGAIYAISESGGKNLVICEGSLV
jgi:hypothetical protein